MQVLLRNFAMMTYFKLQNDQCLAMCGNPATSKESSAKAQVQNGDKDRGPTLSGSVYS